MKAHPLVSEKMLLFLLAGVQFVNILDFMMVMPLGPDFAKALDIPLPHLGYIGGAYMFAASLAGLLGIFFLERFNRRKAYVFSVFGLAIATLLGAVAFDSASLIIARFLAGMFGGPATALSLAIISDFIPNSRRGRAMGVVMASFSLAAVLGVPISLEMATRGGWQTPFIAVGALGLVAGFLALKWLPNPYRPAITDSDAAPAKSSPKVLFKNKNVFLALSMNFLTTVSIFLIVPHIASHLQQNLHFPRAKLSHLYLLGGLLSLIAMQVTGKAVDRVGSSIPGSLGILGMVAVLFFGFYLPVPPVSIYVLFGSLMLVVSIRNVSFQTLHSKVPGSRDRATYMSALSMLTHVGCAVGAFISTLFLVSNPDGSLDGVPGLALASIVFSLSTLPLVWVIERAVRANTAKNPVPPLPDPL